MCSEVHEKQGCVCCCAWMCQNLLAQLLIMLVLFLGSCIGVCCLIKIDTPTTFSDKPLVINKEY